MSDENIDLKLLDPILEEYKTQKGAVIPILQRAQDIYGYLPKEVLTSIAKKTGIPISQLYGVVTFYAQFNLERRGRHLVRICDGTACHVRGAPRIVEVVKVRPNEITLQREYIDRHINATRAAYSLDRQNA